MTVWQAEPDAILTADIERKHARVGFCGFQPGMPGIGLYNFQRNPMLDQVHTEAVTERVAGNRDTKSDRVTFCEVQCLPDPVTRRVITLHRPEQLLFTNTQGGQKFTHLPDILRIGQRNKTEHLFILARPAAATLTLFKRLQPDKRPGTVKLKAGAGQRQRLINTRARVPEGIEKDLLAQVWHIPQKHRHLRGQQVFG
ncbi:hypothetical protein NX82_07025 [Proteus mirabilis]|nr:hypothetical protein NX82_07025 [Proteus mirabilis]